MARGLSVHTGAVLTHTLPSSITYAGGPGRDGIIDFTPGSELLITKAKNGHLAVVSGTWDWGGTSGDQGVLAVLGYHTTCHPVAHLGPE